MKREVRARRVDKDEFWVETRVYFDTWKLVAIVYEYNLARKIANILKAN